MMERKPSAIESPSQSIQETWQLQSQLKYHVFSFSIAWELHLYYYSRFDLIMKPQSQLRKEPNKVTSISFPVVVELLYDIANHGL
jgi:hypothetical protein